MRKICRYVGMGILALFLCACGSSGTTQRAEQKSNQLFDELNKAAERNANRHHLRVDVTTPQGKDITCETGKKRKTETTLARRTITDYDFEHQSYVTYYYKGENVEEKTKEKKGLASAFLDGDSAILRFKEVNGKRQYSPTKKAVTKPAALSQKEDFEEEIHDDERALYNIKKEHHEDEDIYILTMKDPDTMKLYYEKQLKAHGRQYLQWNGCALKQRKEQAIRLTYHVDHDGYLQTMDIYVKRQLDDFTHIYESHITYSSFEELEEEPFQSMLKEGTLLNP